MFRGWKASVVGHKSRCGLAPEEGVQEGGVRLCVEIGDGAERCNKGKDFRQLLKTEREQWKLAGGPQCREGVL